MLGKVADWRIPLGPYTPAQIAVAVGGGFLLVKSIHWWLWMGPVPIVAWVLVIWVVRRPKIAGRVPVQAAVGWVLLGWQPRGGRIGGRAARDRGPRPLLGAFTIEGALAPDLAVTAPGARRSALRAPLPQPAAGRSFARHRTRPAAPAVLARPVSGVQQLVALAQQTGGVR
ncbi:hypothetical protein ACFWJM_05795 [Streptomyces sp. NPDC127077]|uniref:hypothetical protein n=1 Tax=Streptomyces sp. NPDC127077 TaxID=3347131 RepID=UPI00365D47ED